MADCLNCINCIRQEVYDGQWGRFQFSKRCSVGVLVIRDGKINPWDEPCNKLEYGEPKIVSMSKEEKRKY